MTNAELIQTIRTEIERLIEESDFDESANLYSLLSFLSTLESEKPNDQAVEGEVILNGHGLLVDVTKWDDGYKLKVIIKEEDRT